MDNLEREVATIFPVVHRVAGWAVWCRVGGDSWPVTVMLMAD